MEIYYRLFILWLLIVNLCRAEILPDLANALGCKKFVKLLSDAGLMGMLSRSGSGPFTLFVPNDQAFKQLPKGTLSRIRKDSFLLSSIMRYHILSWKLYAREFTNDQRIVTLNNNMKMRINFYGKTMTADGAEVLQANQEASNGIIHVIDRWLYQLPSQNALQYLSSHENFTKFVYPFFKVDLQHLLTDEPHTIFAPVNSAYDREHIPPVLLIKFLQNEKKLVPALKYTVVKGTYFKAGLPNRTLETIDGKSINIENKSGKLKIDDTTVIQSDIPVVNGVIHVIDQILLPQYEPF